MGRVGMKLVVLLISILLSIPCHAITSRAAWDGWHVMGSCIGTAYLNHAGLSWKKSAAIMLAAGILWECFDQIAKNNGEDSNIFDTRRGFDYQDIIRNGIGVSLSFPIRKK